MVLKEDNMGCISNAQNDLVNDRTKKMDIMYLIICAHVRKGDIKLQYISTTYMKADIMKQSICLPYYKYLVDNIGMTA